MLSDVSILVTAGGRPGYLRRTLCAIRHFLPECKIVVVNDDEQAGFGYHSEVIWREMPFDTFLTAKRNAGVALIDTKYTLLAADDFDFGWDTRTVVIKMTEILDRFHMSVIAGTVNNRPYEGWLEVKAGEYIKEHRLAPENCTFLTHQRAKIYSVDIAVNWFLARTEALRDVPWDETIGPIGGEHVDWFLDLKAAKRAAVWTPGLNINEQPKDPDCESPDYRARRMRAATTGHVLMMKKRNIKHYYGFDEEVK